MKKADLEKQKGLKLAGAGTTPDRFGKGASAVLDKREQRERDRELGLVPFAVKLHSDLVRDLHAAAQKKGVGLNELTAELLRKGLGSK
jgi:hypothetical protein